MLRNQEANLREAPPGPHIAYRILISIRPALFRPAIMALISPESSPYVYTVAAALFALVLLRVNSRRRRLPYPPGPKGLPVIGNIRDISAGYEWLTYAKWGQEYGAWCGIDVSMRHS